MIVQLQVLSRIIDGKDYAFIEENNLTREMFEGYEDVFDFIVDHYQNYKVIPDDVTVLQKFPEIELYNVTESDEYLIDALKDNAVSINLTSIFSKANEISDSKGNVEALNYLKQAILNLDAETKIDSVDIISAVKERVEHSTDVALNKADWFIPTGFDELDADINGFQRGNELVVLYARTNQGKSWISEKIATFMAEIGFRVGYFEPEMDKLDVGYRFDTLHGHLSNNAMRLGRFDDEFSLDTYSEYAESLSNITGKLLMTNPKTFNRKATVSKLRQWIKADNLDVMFIDGITYLSDERYKRGDSKTISLTNISEDLIELSAEMKLPIIIVVQANRGGVVDKNSLDTPELENIRDSDGIAQNASIVYAIRQVKTGNGETFLIFDNKKMRGGEVGKSYKYRWDINYGKFEPVVDSDINLDTEDEDAPIREKTEKKEPTYSKRASRERANEDDF